MTVMNQTVKKDSALELSVLLTGYGTVEIHRSMFTALIDMGCHVFWDYDSDSANIFDRKIDFIFHLNLLPLGTEYIDRLRKKLDRQNPDAIIIDMPLAHPVINTVGLKLSTQNETNQFLSTRKIFQWSMCETTIKEWTDFGFINGFFAPLGINTEVYLTPKKEAPIGNWFNKSSSLVKYSLIEATEFENKSDPSISDKTQLLFENKILYAGVPNSEWQDQIPLDKGDEIGFLRENFIPNSKEAYKKMSPIKVEPGDLRSFIQFHYSWTINVPLQRRRKMVRAIVERFGASTSIWGDGWDEYIDKFQPHSQTPRYFYGSAACCVDFGSLQFDSPLYPRTCEIIKRQGLLISGANGNSNEYFHETQFRTVDEMLDLIELLFDTEKRHQMLEKQMSFNSKFSFERILYNILQRAYVS